MCTHWAEARPHATWHRRSRKNGRNFQIFEPPDSGLNSFLELWPMLWDLQRRVWFQVVLVLLSDQMPYILSFQLEVPVFHNQYILLAERMLCSLICVRNLIDRPPVLPPVGIGEHLFPASYPCNVSRGLWVYATWKTLWLFWGPLYFESDCLVLIRKINSNFEFSPWPVWGSSSDLFLTLSHVNYRKCSPAEEIGHFQDCSLQKSLTLFTKKGSNRQGRNIY